MRLGRRRGAGRQAEPLARVARAQGLPPVAPVQVPGHGATQARVERLLDELLGAVRAREPHPNRPQARFEGQVDLEERAAPPLGLDELVDLGLPKGVCWETERIAGFDLASLDGAREQAGGHGRRFDIVLWVNGFPLVVGELKTPLAARTSWMKGASELVDTYQVERPGFFVPNANRANIVRWQNSTSRDNSETRSISQAAIPSRNMWFC